MSNNFDEIKDHMDRFISNKPVFTESDKRKIREGIINMKKTNERKSLFILPKALTGIALAAFIFVVGAIVNEKIGFFEQESRSGSDTVVNKTSQPKEKEVVTPEDNVPTYSVAIKPELVPVYQSYTETKDEALLEGLEPVDIFTFYIKASEEGDYETQFALSIQDEEYIKPFESPEALKEEDEGMREQRLAGIEKIKGLKVKQRIVDENNAYIVIDAENGLGFSLVKDKNGIWKANWLPFQ
ncbi:hypothetical protein LCL95_02045 [Bacillus timonensis]|nr:hypothetical protein [Bacillus timonensis]